MRKFLRVQPTWLGMALACFLVAPTVRGEPRSVWIDTDLSIGSPLREVDDAYALLLAFNSPELRVVGLSSTYGNAPLRATTERTGDLLRRLRRSAGVEAGAASPRELGKRTAATEALRRALDAAPLTYVALGPLTDLASFLTLHPHQADRIERVIMVAGKTPAATLGFGPKAEFRIHDANFVKDPAALRIVLESRLPLVLAPIETSSRLLILKEDLRQLQRASPAARYVAQKSGIWLWFWTHFAHAKGGPIFDALAVVAAAQPGLLTLDVRRVAIDNGDLLVRQNGKTGRPVLFCSGFAPGTKGFVLQRLRAK